MQLPPLPLDAFPITDACYSTDACLCMHEECCRSVLVPFALLRLPAVHFDGARLQAFLPVLRQFAYF
jgi:hypothetical protein